MPEKMYKITFYTQDGMAQSGYISVPQGEKGPPGERGKPFEYSDFTREQLEALRGPRGKDGYTPVKGIDYFDGTNGKNGVDGHTPVKGVDYFDGTDGKDGVDGHTPVKGVDYFDGKDGKDGADGYTPIKGVDYFDGADGVDGQGIIPAMTANVSATAFATNKIGISDLAFSRTPVVGDTIIGANGCLGTVKSVTSSIVTVTSIGVSLKGNDGEPGEDGETGPAYTLTDDDKDELVESVIAALPVYDGSVTSA